MSPRKTPLILTTKELELLVNLLKRHVSVAQYSEDSPQMELFKHLDNIYEIAKELEPIEYGPT